MLQYLREPHEGGRLTTIIGVAFVISCLIAVHLPGAAAGRRYRTESKPYDGDSTGVALSEVPIRSRGALTFLPSAHERYISITIDDGLAPGPIYAVVGQDKDGDNSMDKPRWFCGSISNLKVWATDDPDDLLAGKNPLIYVYLYLGGPCGTSVSVPTEGEVTVTFSAKRQRA